MDQRRLCYVLAAAFLMLASCAKDKAPDTSADKTMKMGVTKDNIPADNFTTAEVTLKVGNTIPAGQNDVVFTALSGTFTSGTATYSTNFNPDGLAKAYLKCGTAQSVAVTATVHSLYTNQTTVTFVTAYPDYLTLDVPADSVQNIPGLKFAVTAHLNKISGSFGAGLAVNYQAVSDNGTHLGAFNNIRPSDANGVSTADFYLQDTAFRGNVHIQAQLTAGSANPGNNQVKIFKKK